MNKKPKHPMQPVYLKDKVARFWPNAIVRYLLDNGGIDLNQIALQGFSNADQTQFAQLIGYSVSGAGDLSYFDRKVLDQADQAVEELLKEKANGR